MKVVIVRFKFKEGIRENSNGSELREEASFDAFGGNMIPGEQENQE